ncbi:MAG TPA: hypothetical protein VFI11_07630 [Anaerolineales bacterium]|nr:hypothetical protein [Anaerolineales bacterium]
MPTLEATPQPASTLAIISIQMFDLTTGWAIGRVEGNYLTLRTTDGGIAWREVGLEECPAYILSSADDRLAWTGDDPVCLTTDGGQTWTAVEAPGRNVWFNDDRRGWSLGAEEWGLSFRQFDIYSFATTDDGGVTWAETNPPPGSGVAYLAFPDAQTAWALRAGFAKSIDGVPNLGVPISLHTTFDRGGTWTTRQVPLPPEAETVDWGSMGEYLAGFGNCEFVSPVFSSLAVWKFALTCEDASWMYTSLNQGKTWSINPMPAGVEATIDFSRPDLGWLHVADWENDLGRLYQTSDGGRTWALIKRTGWLDVVLSFVDAQSGWAVACTGPCRSGDSSVALVRTTDGGRTWETIEPQLVP